MGAVWRRICAVGRWTGLTADDVFSTWVFFVRSMEMTVVGSAAMAVFLWGIKHFRTPATPVIAKLLPVETQMPVFFAMALAALRLSLLVLATCVAAGALFRLLYLTRLVYRVASPVGKVIFVGIPVLCLAGLTIERWTEGVSWKEGTILAVIPVILLMPACFRFTEDLLPELGYLSRRLISGLLPRKRCRPAPGPAPSEPKAKAKADSQQDSRRQTTHDRVPNTDEKRYGAALGLKGKVTFLDVRERYLNLAKQYHPDRVQHLGLKLRETAEEEMKLINEAYEYFTSKYGRKDRK